MMNSESARRIAPDYRDSTPAWDVEKMAPAGAPNIVMIVLDDVGFAQIGAYGSDIRTPHIDRLAAGGVRMRNFHTTGMCSATRSCLLTGRNHHLNHMGAVAEIATGFPGYDFRMPRENGTLAEMLREHGYATFAIGKWHLTPADEYSMGATRQRWPLARGFDRFYGFHGGDTSQYYPRLVADNHQVDPPRTPEQGYHLSEDLTDKAIEFTRDLHNAAPGKPFFLYFAMGAMHTPLHVPKRYIERYRGQFDQGWDTWREQVYQRQLASGILPPATELTPRPQWIPAWNSLTDVERQVAARLMETFAGFFEHTDEQIGRLIAELEFRGELDNTVFIVLSDNGASSEGGRNGMRNNVGFVNGIKESAQEIAEYLDEIGSASTNPHYPFGWAWAGNTPFRRWKQEVHAGGVQDPLVIHWPAGLPDGGAVRPQYLHAIDLAPTLLEIAGAAAPATLQGVPQAPIQGCSVLACMRDANAPAPRATQYFEMRGCRGLYHDGWKVVTYRPRIGLAWDGSDPLRPLAQDPWELYHVAEDFAEMHDVAAQHPEIVANLAAMWWAEAGRNGVLPLDNRGVARLADRKTPLYAPGRRHVLYRSRATIGEYAAVDVKNRSHRITAAVVVPATAADGVIVSMGNSYGGYALFVKDGRPAYVYNHGAKTEYTVVADQALPPGRHEIAMTFAKTGENQGDVRLEVDGQVVATGRVEHTLPYTYNNGDLAIGFSLGLGVSRLYRDQGRFEFTGDIQRVVFSRDDVSRTSTADLEAVAMALQ